MLVTAGPMRMTVRHLLLGSGSQVDNLDIEGQGLPCQWVIGIDIRAVASRLDNGNRPLALTRVQLDDLTRLQLALE
mgnify:CR=1 FL=1